MGKRLYFDSNRAPKQLQIGKNTKNTVLNAWQHHFTQAASCKLKNRIEGMIPMFAEKIVMVAGMNHEQELGVNFSRSTLVMRDRKTGVEVNAVFANLADTDRKIEILTD